MHIPYSVCPRSLRCLSLECAAVDTPLDKDQAEESAVFICIDGENGRLDELSMSLDSARAVPERLDQGRGSKPKSQQRLSPRQREAITKTVFGGTYNAVYCMHIVVYADRGSDAGKPVRTMH